MNPRKRRLKRQARKARRRGVPFGFGDYDLESARRFVVAVLGVEHGAFSFVAEEDTTWLSDHIYDLIGLN